MVCPVDNAEDEPTPRAGSDLERRSSLTSGGRPPERTPVEPSPPARRPAPRQSMSRALILTAADAGEHAPGKRSDGKRSEWWENALSRPSKALHHMSHLPGGQERAKASGPRSLDVRRPPSPLDE